MEPNYRKILRDCSARYIISIPRPLSPSLLELSAMDEILAIKILPQIPHLYSQIHKSPHVFSQYIFLLSDIRLHLYNRLCTLKPEPLSPHSHKRKPRPPLKRTTRITNFAKAPNRIIIFQLQCQPIRTRGMVSIERASTRIHASTVCVDKNT